MCSTQHRLNRNLLMFKYQEENSLEYNHVQHGGQVRDKIVEEFVEAASNDTEGFMTPRKRLSLADSEDDATPTAGGTQKSTNKVALKMIKMEKPDKP